MRLFAFICFDGQRVDSLCTKMQEQSIKPTNKEWRRRHSVGNGTAAPFIRNCRSDLTKSKLEGFWHV